MPQQQYESLIWKLVTVLIISKGQLNGINSRTDILIPVVRITILNGLLLFKVFERSVNVDKKPLSIKLTFDT